MRLLAIETATDACSIALLDNDNVVELHEVEPRRHADLLLDMVERVLRSTGCTLADLDGLAFGCGPGAFTGLRIAAGVIQGLAFGTELSVAPISTLAALAQGVYRLEGQTKVAAGFDARMGEVYWGCYSIEEDGLMSLVDIEEVVAPEAIRMPPGDGWCSAGNAWQSYGEILGQRCGPRVNSQSQLEHPHAQDVARLAVAIFDAGKQVNAADALPTYLRNRVTR